MWISKKDLEIIKEKIQSLESDVYNPYIGELFYEQWNLKRSLSGYFFHERSQPKSWIRFRKNSLTETVGEGKNKLYKIFNNWFEEKNIFFYDDIYKVIRENKVKALKI